MAINNDDVRLMFGHAAAALNFIGSINGELAGRKAIWIGTQHKLHFSGSAAREVSISYRSYTGLDQCRYPASVCRYAFHCSVLYSGRRWYRPH